MFISGFMLFSQFFDAGNLIFPAYLGMESGNYFVAAIAGFMIRTLEHAEDAFYVFIS
ncbi:MAG: branched-chain amino acid transport system II carrier protein [Bacillota bacterium]